MLGLRLFLLPCLLSVVWGTFDLQATNAAVYLSSQAYCQESFYFAREYGNDIPDFVPTKSLSNSGGLVGFSNSRSTIFVVTKGSKTIADFIRENDSEMKRYGKCDNCKVHKNLYHSEQSTIVPIGNEISRLRDVYPEYKVVVTGHGVGGSIATLTAVDLAYAGFDNVHLTTFGALKVGNKAFSDFASDTLRSVNRITHSQDIGPHLPMEESYAHLQGEFHEGQQGVLRMCSGATDSTCAEQYSATEWTLHDHMRYLGQDMHCDAMEQQDMNAGKALPRFDESATLTRRSVDIGRGDHIGRDGRHEPRSREPVIGGGGGVGGGGVSGNGGGGVGGGGGGGINLPKVPSMSPVSSPPNVLAKPFALPTLSPQSLPPLHSLAPVGSKTLAPASLPPASLPPASLPPASMPPVGTLRPFSLPPLGLSPMHEDRPQMPTARGKIGGGGGSEGGGDIDVGPIHGGGGAGRGGGGEIRAGDENDHKHDHRHDHGGSHHKHDHDDDEDDHDHIGHDSGHVHHRHNDDGDDDDDHHHHHLSRDSGDLDRSPIRVDPIHTNRDRREPEDRSPIRVDPVHTNRGHRQPDLDIDHDEDNEDENDHDRSPIEVDNETGKQPIRVDPNIDPVHIKYGRNPPIRVGDLIRGGEQIRGEASRANKRGPGADIDHGPYLGPELGPDHGPKLGPDHEPKLGPGRDRDEPIRGGGGEGGAGGRVGPIHGGGGAGGGGEVDEPDHGGDHHHRHPPVDIGGGYGGAAGGRMVVGGDKPRRDGGSISGDGTFHIRDEGDEGEDEQALPPFSTGGGAAGGGGLGGYVGDFHGGGNAGGSSGGRLVHEEHHDHHSKISKPELPNNPLDDEDEDEDEKNGEGNGGIHIGGGVGDLPNKEKGWKPSLPDKPDKPDKPIPGGGGSQIGAGGDVDKGEGGEKGGGGKVGGAAEGDVDTQPVDSSEGGDEDEALGLHIGIECGGGSNNKDYRPQGVHGTVRCGGGSGSGGNGPGHVTLPPNPNNPDKPKLKPDLNVTDHMQSASVAAATASSGGGDYFRLFNHHGHFTPTAVAGIVAGSLLVALTLLALTRKYCLPRCLNTSGRTEYTRIVELKEVPFKSHYDDSASTPPLSSQHTASRSPSLSSVTTLDACVAATAADGSHGRIVDDPLYSRPPTYRDDADLSVFHLGTFASAVVTGDKGSGCATSGRDKATGTVHGQDMV